MKTIGFEDEGGSFGFSGECIVRRLTVKNSFDTVFH